MSKSKKIVFTNSLGDLLTINDELPTEANFAEIIASIDVYNTKVKKWFTLVVSYKRVGNFPKGSAFNKNINDISNLLKD